ncbi:flagellar basal-body rod protein FlgC [Gammaproteobacteria bacterium]
MSIFKIFDTAGTGLSAQALRLNLVASNMANVDAVSSSRDQTYKSRQPIFRAMMNEFNPNEPATGVKMVAVVESKAPPQMEYNPAHPMADKDGYVFRPNINIVEEMANMISASRAYQSNVEVVNSAKQLASATLRMGE